MKTKKKEKKCSHLWALLSDHWTGTNPHFIVFCQKCLEQKSIPYVYN